MKTEKTCQCGNIMLADQDRCMDCKFLEEILKDLENQENPENQNITKK
jgi:hypothetical protein